MKSNCSSSLDNHLASVVSSKKPHESCGHPVKALHHSLPHLDLAPAHPARHGRDPLHPPGLPPAHQESLNLELLLYGEGQDVGDFGVTSLRPNLAFSFYRVSNLIRF